MKQSVISRYQTGIHKHRSCSWFQQGPLTNHSISSWFSFLSCLLYFGFILTIISSGQKSSQTGFCTAFTHHCQFTLILVSLHLLSPHPDTVVTSIDVSKPSKTWGSPGATVAVPLQREQWGTSSAPQSTSSFARINPATCLFPRLISHAKHQACVNYMIYGLCFSFHCIVKKGLNKDACSGKFSLVCEWPGNS